MGDESQAWGEGKLPLSVTQVYNGKLRGGWQSDPAICCRLLFTQAENPEDTVGPPLETLKTKNQRNREDSPIFRMFFRARFSLNVIKHCRHCLFKRVKQKKLCKR